MFTKKLKESIASAMFARPHADPPAGNDDGAGASGGDAGDKGGPDSSIDKLFDELPNNIPRELMDDPDILDAAKGIKSEKKDEIDSSAADKDKNKKGDKGDGDKMEPTAGKKGDEPPADDDSTFEFENDLEIGGVTFKKEILGKTPAEVLEGVAQIKETIASLQKAATDSKAEIETLLKDPVVADRLKRQQEGVADKPYSTYGMSKDTANALTAALNKAGIEDEASVNEILAAVTKEFAVDVEDNVRQYVNSRIVAGEQERAISLARQKSFENLQGLVKLNPDMALKETDHTKFFTMKENHPEWNTPAGKVFQYWAKTLGSYTKFSELSPAEIYSAAAAKLGLPVALNTGDRDRNMIKNDREKILSALGAKKVAKSLSQKGGTPAGGKKATVDDTGAIEKDKLDDIDYQNDLLESSTEIDDIYKTQEMIKNVRRSR